MQSAHPPSFSIAPPRWPALLLFKLNWLLLVVGPPQWHLLAALAVLSLQLWLLPVLAAPARIAMLARCAMFAVAGILMDQILVAAGILVFEGPWLPAWLVLLWLAFALVLPQLDPLLSKTPRWLLALLGSCGGVLAYGAGFAAGAVEFGHSPALGLVALALPWSLVLPLWRYLQRPFHSLSPLALVMCLLPGTPAPALAETSGWVTLGRADFRVLFWPIYQATLEARQTSFQFPATVPYALTLKYERDISASQIIAATLGQWRHQKLSYPAAWETALHEIFPAVSEGDLLRLEVNDSDTARLLHNGEQVAALSDQDLIRAIAGIWLAENTSHPDFRRQLLGQTR